MRWSWRQWGCSQGPRPPSHPSSGAAGALPCAPQQQPLALHQLAIGSHLGCALQSRLQLAVWSATQAKAAALSAPREGLLPQASPGWASSRAHLSAWASSRAHLSAWAGMKYACRQLKPSLLTTCSCATDGHSPSKRCQAGQPLPGEPCTRDRSWAWGRPHMGCLLCQSEPISVSLHVPGPGSRS